MLSTLEKVSGLLSRQFAFGSFLPVTIFAFLNGALLAWNARWFWTWARPQVSGVVQTSFTTGAILAALVVIAYTVSSVTIFLREILEGKHVDRMLPRSMFLARQREARDRLFTTLVEARRQNAIIRDNRAAWRNRLTTAQQAGSANYPGAMTYDVNGPAAQAVRNILNTYGKGGAVTAAELRDAVDLLVPQLETNDLAQQDKAAGRQLRLDRRDLEVNVDTAGDAWRAVEVQAFTELELRFGKGEVAPTAMGNVAQSIHGYVYSRYALNLDSFWSPLQQLLYSRKAFYAGLTDAKAQLDFLVVCWWLTILSTGVWIVVLGASGHSIWPLITVASAGPALACLFYFLAVKNYRIFGDFVRSAVDLYRFDLLEALHVRVPAGIRDERATWERLERLSTYGQVEQELSYQAGKPPASASS